MSSVVLNLIVIKSGDPDRLVEFYKCLGLKFTKEQHGNGPEHYACAMGGIVFEIYPSNAGPENTLDTRIGFCVPDIADIAARIGQTPSIKRDDSGALNAVISDPDSRKIHLSELPPPAKFPTP